MESRLAYIVSNQWTELLDWITALTFELQKLIDKRRSGLGLESIFCFCIYTLVKMERDERSLRTCEMVLSAVFGNNNASFASLEYWQEDMQVQFIESWVCTMSNRVAYFPQLYSTSSSMA